MDTKEASVIGCEHYGCGHGKKEVVEASHPGCSHPGCDHAKKMIQHVSHDNLPIGDRGPAELYDRKDWKLE